ncbi:MAG: hypothetical protein WBK76_05350 [Candidatus Saccharimonadales bacterium]
MIVKADKVRFTASGIAGLKFENVIYGERSQAGAMGNAGGIILYVLDNDSYMMYHANLADDEKAYAEGLFKIAANEFLFDTYAGGMGNGVFIKKDTHLKVNDDDQAFWYIKNDKTYKISSSVQGVFESVAKALKTGKQGMIDPMHKAWEDKWRDEFKKK